MATKTTIERESSKIDKVDEGRRATMRAAAWSVPIIALASTAPLASASDCTGECGGPS